MPRGQPGNHLHIGAMGRGEHGDVRQARRRLGLRAVPAEAVVSGPQAETNPLKLREIRRVKRVIWFFMPASECLC